MKDTADTKTIDMLKPTAKTSAERQRAYRERKKISATYEKRLDMYISEDAATHMRSLDDYFSLHGNITQKELIERLLKEEYIRHVNDFPPDLFD